MLFSAEANPHAPRRVVVTGVGIITGLGSGWHNNAAGFRAGLVTFRSVSLFDVSRQRATTASEVDLPPHLPPTRLTRKRERRLDRAARLLLLASHEAWLQAGWTTTDNLPTVLGTTSGGMSLGESYLRQALSTPHRFRGQASRAMNYQAQQQGLDLADAFGFRGSTIVIANACASGANAIGHAWELVRFARADCALAGGYDALSQLVFAGFDSLKALSATQCRPFDRDRDGLSLGEGAAMLALESLEHARARKANILGEIIGYGRSFDAHHLTQPDPKGDAAFRSMSLACQRAGLDPASLNYINAHGTGTPLNDSSEALAIQRLLGGNAAKVAVSSTKSSIGHLLGGAGAVETVVCLMALREGWLPPTSTLREVDPVCAFPIVSQPVDAKLEFALTNSFGFGGANASLILRRWN